jgi:hypothetical protein
VATLLLALLATKTGTASRLIALREDDTVSREASLADCNTESDVIVLLDDRRSSS